MGGGGAGGGGVGGGGAGGEGGGQTSTRFDAPENENHWCWLAGVGGAKMWAAPKSAGRTVLSVMSKLLLSLKVNVIADLFWAAFMAIGSLGVSTHVSPAVNVCTLELVSAVRSELSSILYASYCVAAMCKFSCAVVQPSMSINVM